MDIEAESLTRLHQLHLADSALPIGARPHSLGIDILATEGDLAADHVAAFLRDYLYEAGH